MNVVEVSAGKKIGYSVYKNKITRQYVEREVPNPEYNPDDETSQEKVMEKIPAAFSMANVTLKLYAVE